MIVAIDGPAGAGKSSAARALAKRLQFRFLDTGAMYRAVTWAALEAGVALDDDEALAALARGLDLRLESERVLVDGRDVTEAIRTSRVTSLTHHAASNAAVRAHLVTLQRRLAEGANIVCEGRDQGTVVFPRAECKVYLTASPPERARRRLLDLRRRGEELPLEQVLADQTVRDQRDQQRAVGPLVRAHDAIELSTDGLTQSEVVDRLEALVRACLAACAPHAHSTSH